MILSHRLSRSTSSQIVFSYNIIGIISASHHTRYATTTHPHTSLAMNYKSSTSKVSNLTEAMVIVIDSHQTKLVPSLKVGRHMQCNLSTRKETRQESVRRANTMAAWTAVWLVRMAAGARSCKRRHAATPHTPKTPLPPGPQNKSSAPWSIPPPSRKPRCQATNGSPALLLIEPL